jgi:FAD/FMN-containing dehydrogenase
MAHVAFDSLEARRFAGEAVYPGNPRYDELRAPWNAMFDRRPTLIARCGDPDDVAAAIAFARERGSRVSVFGGGHSFPGHSVCDDGVMIDLRPMKRVEVDPEAGTCRVEAGATWGELDAATQAHGLAVTGGRVSTTGVAGLTLGGGSGWLERKCGYTVDNLLSAEIVTAAGEILTASATENPQLFWGLRGGGGNFGVVTSFELRLHRVGPIVLGGILLYPAEMAAATFRRFRDVTSEAPDELGGAAVLITAPAEDFVPEPLRGGPACVVCLCHVGPVDAGERELRPLREFGPPAADLVQPLPYVALQQMIDASNPHGIRNYVTADYLAGLPDEAIDVMCRFHLTKPSPLSEIVVLPGGGAPARVPSDAMAFGRNRRAPFNYIVHSKWIDQSGDDPNLAWTRELAAAMKPFTTGSAYLNFVTEESGDRVVAAFGTRAYARLQALKDRYDPDNVFRSNQNVAPTLARTTEAAAR